MDIRSKSANTASMFHTAVMRAYLNIGNNMEQTQQRCGDEEIVESSALMSSQLSSQLHRWCERCSLVVPYELGIQHP